MNRVEKSAGRSGLTGNIATSNIAMWVAMEIVISTLPQ